MKHFAIGVMVLFSTASLLAQHTISGKVYDRDGAPLPNAAVIELGTMSGSYTDVRGSFELRNVPSAVVVVQVRHLGYKTITDSIEVKGDVQRDYQLEWNPLVSDEFIVVATRSARNTPFTHQNVDKDELESANLAQDLPILLNQTVNVVTTSDAGGGVGYTGMRIRGSDATRINVTVNGVPINDAESHGVFWVNMPDFASTTNNIQIQRGVGTSSNGAGAFGATVNLQTTVLDSNAYVEFNNSYGSFETRRHNVVYNSGLLNDHYQFEGRLSYIGSQGYIDRSASDLRSYYFAGGYYGKKAMVKGVTFSGKEVTQQAWWGTPESRLRGDEAAMREHALNNGFSDEQTDNLLNSGRTYNYYTYDNEIDDYHQTHYQLITGYQPTAHWYLNVTGHYTRGLGFFEQSKYGEQLADFGLPVTTIGGDTLSTSDLVVRRWLDNHFFGGVYSIRYSHGKVGVTIGGASSQYLGKHFGEVIWAQYAGPSNIRQRYYFSDAQKSDHSQYLKVEYALSDLTFFADMQTRSVGYRSEGVDNDQRAISIRQHYFFFNPKAGITWTPNGRNAAYASLAKSSREPVRSDFTDAAPGSVPKPEYLWDAELGWSHQRRHWKGQVAAYYMHYRDQLVLTGEVNDVGSPVRTNVPESYRAGIEVSAEVAFLKYAFWSPNLSLSRNKIVSFNETLYDYTNGFEVITRQHNNTDIAFSPSVVAGSQLGVVLPMGLQLSLLSKYVGRQFLDNTSDVTRSIDAYLVHDLRLNYRLPVRSFERLEFTLLVNNITNKMYASNGYTYSYIYGSMITENFYYPQAGTNWLAGVKWRF